MPKNVALDAGMIRPLELELAAVEQLVLVGGSTGRPSGPPDEVMPRVRSRCAGSRWPAGTGARRVERAAAERARLPAGADDGLRPAC